MTGQASEEKEEEEGRRLDVYYTAMDKTSLDTSSGTLFVMDSLTQDVHVTSNVITYHCSA